MKRGGKPTAGQPVATATAAALSWTRLCNPAVGDRWFWRVWWATGLLKLAFAAVLPFTGDEAYFVVWGKHPDFGYYDHGGMTGWMMALMLWGGDAVWWLRLPAVAAGLVVGWWLREALRARDPARANLVGMLWLLSPAHWLSIPVTTDTPLLVFTALTFATALWADRRERPALGLWALAGLFLGAAFLAKYFAVLTGLGLAGWLLTHRNGPQWAALVALVAGTLPGVAINVAWNWAHGWPNVVFNLATRHTSPGIDPFGPPIVVAMTLALLGPVAWVALFGRNEKGERWWRHPWAQWRALGVRGVVLATLVAFAVFGAVSLLENVGAHWLLSFLPWALLSLGVLLTPAALARAMRRATNVALAVVGLLLVATLAPAEWLRWHRSYPSVALAAYPAETLEAFAPWLGPEVVFAGTSYSQTAQLGFHAKRHVPVLGRGSHHGRQDDLITDLRELDGRDVTIVTHRLRHLETAQEWFDESELHTVSVRGAQWHVLAGRGFRFGVYRENVLREVVERYYPMPSWLARFSRPAPLLRRYGFAAE